MSTLRIFLISMIASLAAANVPAPAAAESGASAATRPGLAQRLGYQIADIVLIINGDDAGMCHAANMATIDAMEKGLMTSATIMVPCPWFPEIADYARANSQASFGIHLTHTSEWRHYRWGPVASRNEVPGLLDPEGYLWRDIRSVYANATPQQAGIEARGQIRKALAAGIDVTHLDSHMGALQYDLRYYQVYRQLAIEFDLPIRMASQAVLETFGAGHLRAELDADGVLYPDYLIHGGRLPGESVAAYWKRMLRNLKPGVTELYIHAALPTDELKRITNSWEARATEHELFTNDPEIRALLDSQGVIRIGYRPLRDLQRRERPVIHAATETTDARRARD